MATAATTTDGDPLAGLPDLAALATFDAGLRQVAHDPPAVEAAIDLARQRLDRSETAGDGPAVLALLGYLGNGLRILARHDEAVACHRRAVALAVALDRPRTEVAATIRLGEALRNLNAFADAEDVLRRALERIRGNRSDLGAYEDFALQHLGKCLTDAGRAAEAVIYLEAALALRHAKADPGLIASTERALRAARTSAQALE